MTKELEETTPLVPSSPKTQLTGAKLILFTTAGSK
jgi:hypothetical protein